MGVNDSSHDSYRGAKVLSVKYALLYQHFIMKKVLLSAMQLQAFKQFWSSISPHFFMSARESMQYGWPALVSMFTLLSTRYVLCWEDT